MSHIIGCIGVYVQKNLQNISIFNYTIMGLSCQSVVAIKIVTYTGRSVVKLLGPGQQSFVFFWVHTPIHRIGFSRTVDVMFKKNIFASLWLNLVWYTTWTRIPMVHYKFISRSEFHSSEPVFHCVILMADH